MRERVIEDILSGAPDAKRAWPEKGMAEDIAAQASQIAVPVHVIVGGADDVETEPSLRAAFGKVLPDTGFTVLPGAGHLSPLKRRRSSQRRSAPQWRDDPLASPRT